MTKLLTQIKMKTENLNKSSLHATVFMQKKKNVGDLQKLIGHSAKYYNGPKNRPNCL